MALDPAWEARSSGSATGVEDMLERLSLTTVEAQPAIMDDDEDVDLVAPDCALVGKVISPTVLRTNTISLTLRPAWGNPRGLQFHPVGDNLFVAERY